MDIIIDTREQHSLPFKTGNKNTIEIKTLNVGDYSLKGLEDKIAIERKSLPDLFGTLGKGNKRFKKELQRAQKLDYFAIIIEGDYDKVLNKDFEGSFYTKMKGHVIISILFTIHVKYGINIFFCKDRYQCVRMIKDIFKSYLKINNIYNK